ncbi:Uncharacterised protein [Vibrio cholerae]|nr:Uncharacterised protein [Vibrio cholerae]
MRSVTNDRFIHHTLVQNIFSRLIRFTYAPTRSVIIHRIENITCFFGNPDKLGKFR